jgi:DNA-binding NtrC family response regulator
MAELHILVIDDKPETRQFISDEVLILNGFEVDVASQGIEGLRKTLTKPYDLIIISLEMEPVNGLDILRELRSFDNTIPVVLITDQASEQISLEIVRLGVHDYVKKPIDPDELLNAIENALCLPQLREQKKEIMTRHVIQANQLLEQRVQNLNALYKVGKSITSLMEPSKIMERIIEAVLFLLDGEECSLTLLDPKTGHVEGKFSHRRPYDPDRVAALIEGQIAPTGKWAIWWWGF